jgi:hypothetical protein
MDRRIEEITRAGSEFVADYVGDVLTAAGKLVDTLMTDVTRLTRGVIVDAGKVVAAACDAFTPDDAR